MQSDKIIICGSGASVPYDPELYKSGKQGLAPLLFETLNNNYTIGLNSWFKYVSPATINFVNDYIFYRNNYEQLGKLDFVLVRNDAQLFTCDKYKLHANTLLLESAKYYFGKESWDCNKKKCLTCNYKIPRTDRTKFCPNHKITKLMPIGFYHIHLAGLISITLAIALGFKYIYLLGMDCCETNGRTHFYQDLVTDYAKDFGVGKLNGKYRTSAYSDIKQLNDRFYAPFGTQTDAKIYNVSLNSGIETFEKISYDTFYDHFKESKIDQKLAVDDIRNLFSEKLNEYNKS